MTTAVTEDRIAQSKKPLLGQIDLRCVHVAAGRILNLRSVAPFLPRTLTRAELQLLTLCDAICGLVRGEFGVDAEGAPIGNLVLKESLTLPVAHQPKLRPTEVEHELKVKGNGARNT